MNAAEWKKFIVDWSASLDRQNFDEYFESKRSFDPQHGFGRAGASEESIIATEKRIGTMLPPSYREFLKATNGLQQPIEGMGTTGGDFWPVEEVDWFRVRNDYWIEAWSDDLEDVPDEEYFVYGDQQDSVGLRREYLKTALELSFHGDSAIYLLIPEVKDKNGEWEAWHFANWMPGAERFRSFEDMMKKHHRNLIENKNADHQFGF